MEILILCNHDDAIAASLSKQLIENGEKVCLVIAEDLLYARSWLHEIDFKGKGFSEIILQNGKIIRSDELKSVWNRIRFFPMAHFKDEADRFYAQNEIHALYISFLKSINHALINPVNTYDLAMESDNLFYLNQQAINAGLPVLDCHFTTSPKWQSSKELVPVSLDKKSASSFRKKAPYLVWQNQPAIFTEPASQIMNVWIVGEEIIGNEINIKKETLKKLAVQLNKTLLQVNFAKTSSGYKVSFIDTFPAFAPKDVIDSLANLLTKKQAS